MATLVEHPDVERDDVALLETALVGDPVNDHVVRRSADRAGNPGSPRTLASAPAVVIDCSAIASSSRGRDPGPDAPPRGGRGCPSRMTPARRIAAISSGDFLEVMDLFGL